jgi:hypothetical protein
VIEAPLVVGAVQVTTTFVPLITVVGAVGVEGLDAAKTETSEEYAEYPYAFLASTRNWYVVPVVRDEDE